LHGTAPNEIDAGSVSIPLPVTIRVVAICLAMILAEGYDVAIYGAVLPMLTHGTNWSLSAFQLGAIASCSLAGQARGSGRDRQHDAARRVYHALLPGA
jgi:AAHS family benzoate transporter-like MFS transporter